jgi:Lar family restriction alleviation protein
MELKPCPFCGADGEILGVEEYWLVSCEYCDAQGPTKKIEQEAITAWNKRSE